VEDERSEGLHKRSAEDWGNPCAAPGQRPQRGLVSVCVRIKRTGIVRVALRQEQAAEEGAKDAKRLTRGRKLPPDQRAFA
jgi:hypothetical protein